jgi:hypothetical protein
MLPWTLPELCELLNGELGSGIKTKGRDEGEVNAEAIAGADGFERPSS